MGELLNLVGLSTGVVLYAMLLAMVVRAPAGVASPSDRAIASRSRPPCWDSPGTCVRCRFTSCSTSGFTRPVRICPWWDFRPSGSCRPSSCIRCCVRATTAAAPAPSGR